MRNQTSWTMGGIAKRNSHGRPGVRIAFLWLLSVVGACSSPAPDPESDTAVEPPLAVESTQPIAQGKINAAIAEIRAEPKVIDVVYDPTEYVEWTIGVKDDGSPRYGYAEYICLRLLELGALAPRTNVRIVDIRKYMEPNGNGRDASLGQVNCENQEHMFP